MNNTQKEKLYKELKRYGEIPETEWHKVEKEIQVVKVKKNDFFIRANDQADKMAFISQGIFRVFFLREDGSEVTIVFRDENKFLSAYSSLLERKESKYFFEALEDSVLLYIPLHIYEELAKGHECWKGIITQYSQQLFIEKENREVDLLLNDAKKRYDNFVSRNPEIEKRVSKKHIASYLGIAPETLSRVLKQ